MNRSLSRSLVLSLLLPTFAAGQGLLTSERRMAIELPQLPAGSEFVRLLPGRIGDDPYLDVVAVNDMDGMRSVLYLQDPMQHNLVAEIQSGVVDATVVAAGGAGRDLLCVLDGQGLTVYRCPAGGQAPEAVQTIGAWAGATCVWPGRNAAGDPLVLGAGANYELLRFAWDGTQFVELGALEMPVPVSKVLTVDYDGQGEVELVVEFAGLVWVVDWDGVYVQDVPYEPGSERFVTVSRGTGSTARTRDLVVACGPYQGQQMLVAFNAGVLATLPLDGIQIADLAAFEHEAPDGTILEEVMIAEGGNESKVHVLRREDSPALLRITGDGVGYQGVHGNELPLGSIQRVVGGDFDGDGDGDVVAFQAANRTLHVIAGNEAPSTRAPFVFEANMPEPVFGQPFTMKVFPTLPENLQAFLDQGNTLELEFLGWAQKDASAAREWQASVVHSVALGGSSLPAFLLLPVPGSDQFEPGEWSIEFRARLVVVSPGGERRVLAPTVTTYTPNPALEDQSENRVERALLGTTIHTGTNGDGNIQETSGGPTSGGPRTP